MMLSGIGGSVPCQRRGLDTRRMWLGLETNQFVHTLRGVPEGTRGPIPTAWAVKGWPTIVVLEKTGEEKWRALIAAQEKSGLGVREFAESRGLAPATMYWWRCRLRERSTSLVPVAVVDDEVAVGRPVRAHAEGVFRREQVGRFRRRGRCEAGRRSWCSTPR